MTACSLCPDLNRAQVPVAGMPARAVLLLSLLSSALAFQGGEVVHLEDMGRSVKLKAEYRF